MTQKKLTQMLVAGLVTGLSTLPVLAQGNSTTTQGRTGSSATGTGGVGMSGSAHSTAGHSAMMQVTMSPEQMQSAMQGAVDRLFMLRAAQGNMAEVALGQLALRKSRNEQVRTLAQHLIQEHSTANAALLPVLSRKGIPLPRFIGAMNAATNDQLARLSRDQFDRMFMSAQVEAHENAIALYQQELAMGQDEDARAYATRFLPNIMSHTMMIYRVARAVNAPGINERPQELINSAMNATAGTNAGTTGSGGTTGSSGATTGGAAQ
jgi:putative membrane protein